MKLSSKLYQGARKLGKAASTLNDVETLASGDLNKIGKRIIRKTAGKEGHKAVNKALNHLK